MRFLTNLRVQWPNGKPSVTADSPFEVLSRIPKDEILRAVLLYMATGQWANDGTRPEWIIDLSRYCGLTGWSETEHVILRYLAINYAEGFQINLPSSCR